MPWKKTDSTKFTKKAKSAKSKRQWKDIANSVLKRGGSDASAIRQASGIIRKTAYSEQLNVMKTQTKGCKMNIQKIAQVAHETNRAFCQSIGDDSQPSWENAPDWQKLSAIDGVNFHIANPNSKPEDSHNNWLRLKYADGWKYGTVKDPDKKEHPCCVSYEQLPIEQRVKDFLFLGVVRAMEILL